MSIRGTKLVYGPFLAAALVAPMTSGCDEDGGGLAGDICGPCGVVVNGDVGISGSAKLDGFFKAVADLNSSVVKVNGSFEADLAALEAAFGLEAAADASLSARVDDLVAEIEGEISANVDGGLVVNVVPAKCSANVNVAIDAQAKCEVSAGCDVQADPGSVSVSCEGSCTGSCSGGCEGTVQCKVSAPSVACEGVCEGSCTVEAGAACNGTCRGDCSGKCSAYVENASGEMECAGSCDGECAGTCELAVGATCEGTCSGSCTVEGGEAECEGEVKCEGSCSGECSGGCEGSATPPSLSAECDASADCQAQASAQASANVECTPPQVDISFAFAAGVDASARAEFSAKLAALKVHGVGMLQGFTKYQALVTGKVNGEVVFETAPLAAIKTELEGIAEAGATGSLFAEVPKGKLLCVIPAFREAGELLLGVGSEATANLAAQGSFATAFTSGFGG